MINVTNEVTIAAPIERVFQVVSDPCMDPKWHFDVVEASPLKGSKAVGAEYLWVFDYMGQGREEALVEIIELEPHHKYSVKADTGALKQTLQFEFERDGDGKTRCTRTLDLEHRDIPPEAEGPWLARIEGRSSRYMDSLKRMIEGMPAEPDSLRTDHCGCAGL